jgi:hypothetical protein
LNDRTSRYFSDELIAARTSGDRANNSGAAVRHRQLLPRLGIKSVEFTDN